MGMAVECPVGNDRRKAHMGSESPVVTRETVEELLDRLAVVYSDLDSLYRQVTDPETLLFAADEAEFYWGEIRGLVSRLKGAAVQVAGLAVV